MKKTCGIYLITCTKPNGDKVFYVGQSINIELRFGQHKYGLKAKRHPNQIMQRFWGKYGAQAFKFEVLEECDQISLNDYENWWLSEMVGYRRCMNIGKEATAPMAGVKFSEDHCRKIAAAVSGDKHYLYGKAMPDETKAKISASGRGIRRSDEAKQRYSDANKGQKNCMFGKSGHQNPRSKPVVGFPVGGGNPIRFASANLCKQAGFMPSEITTCCKGRCVTHKGYVWEYDIGPDTVPTKGGVSKRFESTRNQSGRFERWSPIKDQTHQRLQIEPPTGAVSELPQILI